jgi:hypothetical protein
MFFKVWSVVDIGFFLISRQAGRLWLPDSFVPGKDLDGHPRPPS